MDSAFWSRTHREDFAAIVARGGGKHRIVYLKASEDLLRSRIAGRSVRFDANAALPIDEATIVRFLASFQEPQADEDALLVAA